MTGKKKRLKNLSKSTSSPYLAASSTLRTSVAGYSRHGALTAVGIDRSARQKELEKKKRKEIATGAELLELFWIYNP